MLYIWQKPSYLHDMHDDSTCFSSPQSLNSKLEIIDLELGLSP